MKRYKNIIFWILITGFLVITISFISDKSSSIICNKISILVTDSLENTFVERKDIVALLLNKNPKILGVAFNEINTEKIENDIIKHPSISSSEVYKTIDGRLNIIVDQKNPIIRIYSKSGKGFYIDQKGCFMPLSNKYSSLVVIGNGEINVNINYDKTPDIKSLNNKTLTDLYFIALFLNNDQFWNSQIEQIYVKNNGEYELIPRVGSQIILLGTANDLEIKLRNLKAVYLNGFSKTSWTKYEYINLKYNNQVICTKR
ncbi:MAG: hypothetical protein JXB17_02450 [Bacteroidales bacterium]|nr:hypothetical protein [Bacteroidales bacterium]